MIKNVYWSSCPVLKKLEFSPTDFRKISNIKFHENPSSGRRVVPCGRTDGQTRSQQSLFAVLQARVQFPSSGPPTVEPQ